MPEVPPESELAPLALIDREGARVSASPCTVCGSPSVAVVRISVVEPHEYELVGAVCAEHLAEVTHHAALYRDQLEVTMSG